MTRKQRRQKYNIELKVLTQDYILDGMDCVEARKRAKDRLEFIRQVNNIDTSKVSAKATTCG